MARIPASERRAELVDAAVRVIAAHGVDGATTRKIADAAGAPLATLHYCFASKEVLFAEVFDHVAGLYRDVLVRNDCHGDVKTTARSLLRGMMQWYLANPDVGRAILELLSWARRQDGGQGVMVYTEANRTLRGILEADAAAAGQSLSDGQLDALTYVVTTLSDGFALNWLVFADREVAIQQMELTTAILDMWLDANLAPGGAPQPTVVQQEHVPLLSWVTVG